MADVCAQSVSLADFTITFVNVTYNPDGTSTWTYTITNVNQKFALSDWAIRLCFANGDPIVSCTPPPGDTCSETNPAGDPNICGDDTISTDPCAGVGLRGIKFVSSLSIGQTKTYAFTLNQPFAVEPTCFGIKFDNIVRCGSICGPSPNCNLIPVVPRVRGIIV